MSTVICNCKRCKIGKRVDYSAGREKSGQYSWPYRIDDSGRRVFPGIEMHGISNEIGGDGKCPGCGKRMTWNYLKAVLVVEHKCDARCTNARGHSCECSCGGKNHGQGWAA